MSVAAADRRVLHGRATLVRPGWCDLAGANARKKDPAPVTDFSLCDGGGIVDAECGCRRRRNGGGLGALAC